MIGKQSSSFDIDWQADLLHNPQRFQSGGNFHQGEQ
jgi:hypothetical protein